MPCSHFGYRQFKLVLLCIYRTLMRGRWQDKSGASERKCRLQPVPLFVGLAVCTLRVPVGQLVRSVLHRASPARPPTLPSAGWTGPGTDDSIMASRVPMIATVRQLGILSRGAAFSDQFI